MRQNAVLFQLLFMLLSLCHFLCLTFFFPYEGAVTLYRVFAVIGISCHLLVNLRYLGRERPHLPLRRQQKKYNEDTQLKARAGLALQRRWLLWIVYTFLFALGTGSTIWSVSLPAPPSEGSRVGGDLNASGITAGTRREGSGIKYHHSLFIFLLAFVPTTNYWFLDCFEHSADVLKLKISGSSESVDSVMADFMDSTQLLLVLIDPGQRALIPQPLQIVILVLSLANYATPTILLGQFGLKDWLSPLTIYTVVDKIVVDGARLIIRLLLILRYQAGDENILEMFLGKNAFVLAVAFKPYLWKFYVLLSKKIPREKNPLSEVSPPDAGDEQQPFDSLLLTGDPEMQLKFRGPKTEGPRHEETDAGTATASREKSRNGPENSEEKGNSGTECEQEL